MVPDDGGLVIGNGDGGDTGQRQDHQNHQADNRDATVIVAEMFIEKVSVHVFSFESPRPVKHSGFGPARSACG
ncbi:hypothetical protein DESC_850010 [Desulfosarcina cetonica]|nr:hypothetical protein DESC_850010 [Desulfosarcina cetonica]